MEDYEKKIVEVLNERADEITKHFNELRAELKIQKEEGLRNEEEYKKAMNRIKSREFEKLHDLDILVTKFKRATVIDDGTEVWK